MSEEITISRKGLLLPEGINKIPRRDRAGFPYSLGDWKAIDEINISYVIVDVFKDNKVEKIEPLGLRYEKAFKETQEILADREFMEGLEEGIADAKEGRLTSLKDLIKELELQ